MKFNKIYEMIISVPIVEQAFKYKEAKDKISNLDFEIGEHLTKLIMFGQNSEYSQHWRVELVGWIRPMARIKTKNNIELDYFELLYTNPWEDNLKGINSMIKDILEDYPKYTTKITDGVVIQEKLKNALKAICEKIERDDVHNLHEFLKAI